LTLFGWLWLVLICCEKKVLLAGWWLVLVWYERKILLVGCSEQSDQNHLVGRGGRSWRGGRVGLPYV